MRFLRTLDSGDKFRPAHARQVSLNDRRMSRSTVYKVERVYPMDPHLAIAVDVERPDDGFYSLGPDTPVLLPKELDPSDDEIFQFIGVKARHRVVAYRVLWDGKTDLSRIVPPQAVAAMKLMYSVGKSEYGARELSELFCKHYEKFLGRPVKYASPAVVLYIYRRNLVNHGLLEEVLDVGPIPESVRAANLGGAW